MAKRKRKTQTDQGVDSLPLYPEGRACVRPTTRQLLDFFEPVSRHTLMQGDDVFEESFSTDLSPLHRTLLKLLRVPATDYRD